MKKNILSIILAFALPIVIIIGAVCFLIVRNTSNADLPTFPATTYSENALALRGNNYSLNVAVEKQLAQNATGRILSVIILPDGNALLPIFVPAEKALNIEVGQRLALTVFVDESSTIVVKSIAKF